MQDGRRAFRHADDTAPVADIAELNLKAAAQLLRDRLKPAGRAEGVVKRERPHFPALFQQRFNQMRADEPISAGHQNRTRHACPHKIVRAGTMPPAPDAGRYIRQGIG